MSHVLIVIFGTKKILKKKKWFLLLNMKPGMHVCKSVMCFSVSIKYYWHIDVTLNIFPIIFILFHVTHEVKPKIFLCFYNMEWNEMKWMLISGRKIDYKNHKVFYFYSHITFFLQYKRVFIKKTVRKRKQEFAIKQFKLFL